eukprot:713568-Hanusia_phi.AAC.1
MVHVALQPSPEIELPSSQASSELMTPSPHNEGDGDETRIGVLEDTNTVNVLDEIDGTGVLDDKADSTDVLDDEIDSTG